MDQDRENSLAHYGVLGMRWGIRRQRRAEKKARKSKKNEDISELSYQQLLDKVNRLNLEKRYYELSQPQKSAGKKFVDDVIRDSGKEVAKKYVTKGMDAVVNAMIKKANTSSSGKKSKK